MIIFKQQEYNAWAACNEKYLHLYADARRQYSKDKNRKKYDNAVYKIGHEEENERDLIESPALYRTVEGFSTKKILQDAKATILYTAYQAYLKADAEKEAFDREDIKPDFSAYTGAVDLRVLAHLDVLRDDRKAPEKAQEIQDVIDRYLAGAITREECEPYKDYEMIRVEIPVNKDLAPIAGDVSTALIIQQTNYPKTFLTTLDKVSSSIFEGKIKPFVETTVTTAKRGSNKADLSAVVTINYDDLADVQLINRPKGLTAYDREVSDAITSLYTIGDNDVITDLMIYRVMTGNPRAVLNPPQQQSVNDSIAVLRGTIVKINMSQEEADAYKVEAISYEGNLLNIERVTVKLKGQVTNAYKIGRTPILYSYADSKNQVGRVPIDVINTKLRKSPEIITLQGYLLRRIVAMQNRNNKISHTILYSTIFDNLNIGEGLANAAQIRKKKSKINQAIGEILTEWKEKGFIIDYTVNKKGNSIISVTIEP